MATFKWAILLVFIPAVFSANLFRELEGACANDGECSKIPNAVCNEEKKCACKSDYVAISGGCLPKVKYNGTCSDDVQCSAIVPNAICKSATKEKHCDCIDDTYYFNDKECRLKKYVDEDCKVGDCFTPNSQCVDDKCRCNTGYKQVDKECVLNQLGDECAKDVDCTIENSKCTDKKCACKDNYFIHDGKCVGGLGAECENSEECKATDSECRERTCQCKSEYVGTSVSECLIILKHNQECKHNLQCSAGLAHTFCNSTKEAATGVCDCEEAYLFQKDKCYQKKWANEKCTENDFCVVANTRCNAGKCECVPELPELIDGVCSSSIIIRPLFSAVVLVLLALKVMF